jgi:HEPN domain-containing protein
LWAGNAATFLTLSPGRPQGYRPKKYIVVPFIVRRKAFLFTWHVVEYEIIRLICYGKHRKTDRLLAQRRRRRSACGGSLRHGLFFIHLAFEKILKAHVCRKTGELSPRSHNIFRLLELSGLQHSREDSLFLANLNKYNIEGRYPDSYEDLPDSSEVEDIITTGGRIFQWLCDQL